MTNHPKQSPKYFNYPQSRSGPDIPYENERKSGPALRGWQLVISASLLEWLGFLRYLIWHNAGFGDLRKIQQHLGDYEPRFDPTVIPISNPTANVDDRKHDLSDSENPFVDGSPTKKYYSVADYHELYTSGELTPTKVVQAILPLIRRDLVPPGKHSIAWWANRVDLILEAAKASTLRYEQKCPLGVLDGVPTGVKDEFDVDGYPTTLGSVNDYTSDVTPGESTTSWAVRKLEEAGAINLGKLSMHEFGLDTSGNNPNYGTPRNPYNPHYYPGGSSGGCAYAISTGIIPIAIGSDGGGSVRIPASFCSVFGLKPSHGRISYKPAVNHANSCGVIGPLAADIPSLKAIFRVISAPDPACTTASLFPPESQLSWSPPSPNQAKILGIPEAWFDDSTASVQSLCHTFLSRLVSQKNYTLVPITIPFLPQGQTAHALTMLTDAATALPQTHNLTPANKILIALGSATPSTDYLLAQKLRQLLLQHLAHLWKEYPGMIIVTPTTACAGWQMQEGDLSRGLSDGDKTKETMEYVWLANFAGCPALTVPVGFVAAEKGVEKEDGENENGEGDIPVGLMGMGEWACEEQLLRWGEDAEALGSKERRRPPNWVDVIGRARGEMHKIDGREGEEQ